MSKKTYRSVHAKHLVVPVNKFGKTIFCDFTGGTYYPKDINGAFITSDKEIQKQLEAKKAFGKIYDLEKTVLAEDEKKIGKTVVSIKEKAEAKKAKQEALEEENKKKAHGSSEPLEVKGIRTFNEARNYLRKEKNVEWSKLKNKEDVLAQAQEKKVVFVDWK